MKLRAIIKRKDDWWIGWLVDIPGVNAQEKTKEELLESLRIGAEDMLTVDVSVEPGAQIEMVDILSTGQDTPPTISINQIN